MTNALDGSEDDLVCREAHTHWDEVGMGEHRASAVADVNDEVDAGRLIWRYRDVCSVICAHPARGHLDFQADDDGSNGDATEARDPAEWEMSDEDQTEANAVSNSVVDNADSSASAVAEAQAPPQDLCNDLRHRAEKLETLRTVLLQVEQAGAESIANRVRQAIHSEKKKMQDVAHASESVRQAFAVAEEEAERRALREREETRVQDAVTVRAKRTLEDLLREQEVLRERKAELARASSVEESLRALKRWTAADFGQGHPRGGTRVHAANRREVLERLRRRAPALPPDLSNDWNFCLQTWEDRRLTMLREAHRPGRGATFLNLLLDLHRDMRANPNGDTFALWIRREMRWEHFPLAPLRL